ncbi:MAG: DUF4157 domain-containing protein [Rhodocyclales bacterium]|nr:DUF4157 domain-containing protein [Rhodocyclales bacterium]
MAAPTQKSKAAPEKKAENKVAKKAASAQRAEKPDAAKPPAYMQAKLAVSHPQDSAEKEADKVAQQVARAPKPAPAAPEKTSEKKAQRASLEPAITPEKKDTMALKPVPAAENIQRRPAPAGAEKKVDKKQEPSATASNSGTTNVQREAADHMAGQQTSAEVESRIEACRGGGTTLPDEIKKEMEAKFGRDFGSVRIHTDAEAAGLCAETNARAFTVGTDIFFAPGEFAPETDSGKELLAHELTHVVQQEGTIERIHRAVTPAPTSPPASGTPAATALDAISVLDLPPIKHRHAALYTGAGARRAAGYSRNTSEEQIDVWNRDVSLTEATIENKLKERIPDFIRPSSPSGEVIFKVGSTEISSSWRRLRSRLLIPDWDRRGQQLTTRENRFQVDHMVELQVFGDTTGNAGNVKSNMELLKGSANASSGSTIKNSIYDKVTTWLAASDPSFAALSPDRKRERRREWLRTHTISFTDIRRTEGRAGQDADWWTLAEIEAGIPIEQAQAAPATSLRGSPGTFVLASGVGGIQIASYSYTNLQFQPATDVLRNAVAGIRIQEFNLNSETESGSAGTSIGSLRGTWNLPNGFRANEPVTIPLTAVAPYCGALGEIPALNTDFTHLCPVSFPTIDLQDGQLYAEGLIDPTISLLRGHPIKVIMEGDDLRFEISYSPSMVSIPIPGVTLDDCTLALFYSTRRGFGGSGSIEFSVPRLGSGELEVQVTERDGFSAAGGFHFDTKLFDQADLRVWYRDEALGGEGTLGITQPNKVRGIRSAQITARFDENAFSANGNVQPDIPGVQEATLRVEYGEESGLTIGGMLQLSANPAIRSGSVDVTVRKLGEEWKVAATGTAQPAIPGINSQLTVGYDDGAFTAEFSGAYARGMLSGNATVGATNRTVGEDGRPTGAAAPDAPIVIYGNGSAMIQIAPWLQGTAGIRFAPNGEVTVTGEIGLPSQLDIFPRKEINKPLFGMSTQIPIFPGIVAEVGGNLSASASIGPGALDQLRIGIEYNPAHEENTHITGDAHLNIPAEAGMRLGARAGIGLGITGASATGGLELGGTLGISGAAEAGVHIDWMPTTGLQVDAEGYLHAEPKFKFDVSGYVAVTALGFSVYDNRWELAAYELGSNLRLGVRFPIHYREGQPFDVSLDDVQFEVPNVDPAAMVHELGNRIF